MQSQGIPVDPVNHCSISQRSLIIKAGNVPYRTQIVFSLGGSKARHLNDFGIGAEVTANLRKTGCNYHYAL